MRKVILIVILALTAIGVIACGGAPATPTKPVGTSVPVIKVSNRIVAEGKVVPARFATQVSNRRAR